MNQAGIPPTCLQNRTHCLAYWCGENNAEPASDVFAFVSIVFSGCSQRPAFSRSKGVRINISIFLPTPTVSHLIQLVFLLWRAAICKKKWKSTTCQFIQANDVYTDIPHWWNRPNIPFPVQRREGGENERQKGVTQAPLPPAFFLLSNLYLTLPSLALLRLHPAQPEPEHWYQAADVLPHPKHTHSLKIHTHCILGGGGGGWGGGRRKRLAHLLACNFRAFLLAFWNQVQKMYSSATGAWCQMIQVSRESGPLESGNSSDAWEWGKCLAKRFKLAPFSQAPSMVFKHLVHKYGLILWECFACPVAVGTQHHWKSWRLCHHSHKNNKNIPL